MREIKFRRPFFRHSDGKFEGFGYWGIFDREFRSPPSWSHCHHGEDQQLTGLKDRHGVEIYEEDIIQWANEHILITAKVVWIDCAFELQEEHDDGTYSYYALSDDATLQDMQVIGNIFENKDLLGGV